MPACKDYGIKAGLRVSALDESLTGNLQLSMRNTQATESQRITKALGSGDFLAEDDVVGSETPIRLGGDAWMPLYMVKTKEHDGVSSSCQSSQAIALSVQASTKAFHDPAEPRAALKDIQIEVYLNGDLVSVALVAGANASRVMGRSDRTMLLSGTRIHRQSEKPWTYCPSFTKKQPGNASSRWDEIRSHMVEIAKQKFSRGQSSLSGRFIEELAKQTLPDKITSERFALLDLVIVGGKGTKYDATTSYLKSPTMLSNPADAPASKLTASPSRQPKLAPAAKVQLLPRLDFYPDVLSSGSEELSVELAEFANSSTASQVLETEGTELDFAVDEHFSNSYLFPDADDALAHVGDWTMFAPGPSSIKETLHPLHLPDLNEVFTACLDPRLRGLTAQNDRGSTTEENVQTALPVEHPATATKNNLDLPTIMHTSEFITTSSIDMSVWSASSPSGEALRTPRRRNAPTVSPYSSGSRRTRTRWDPFEITPDEAAQDFVIPPLMRDSAITYAGPGLQRQVPKVRGGEFDEQYFVCGMRFIVE